jgi:hypothetical protein
MRAASVSDKRSYLRADLIHRQSARELEKFLYVHVQRASFKIDKFHGSRFIDALAAHPSLKVALVATHREVQLVQQYIEALARLKGAALRSFTDEAGALAWLRTPAPGRNSKTEVLKRQ